MANVSKTYGVGDTVWVVYSNSIANQYTPLSRVVSKVNVNSSTNEAVVEFVTGENVVDGAVVTVHATQALAAATIVTKVIADTAAAVALDATLSITSTASQASTTLGRIG